jgi:hypothetical protein
LFFVEIKFSKDKNLTVVVDKLSFGSALDFRPRFFFATDSSSPFWLKAIGFRTDFSIGGFSSFASGITEGTEESCTGCFAPPSSSSSTVDFRRRTPVKSKFIQTSSSIPSYLFLTDLKHLLINH